MPKIITNLEDRLVAEAKRQIEALLTWTAAGRPFEAIFGMIEKLI